MQGARRPWNRSDTCVSKSLRWLHSTPLFDCFAQVTTPALDFEFLKQGAQFEWILE
jgi:hypothetical protein